MKANIFNQVTYRDHLVAKGMSGYAPNKQDREKEREIGTITESCRQWMHPRGITPLLSRMAAKTWYSSSPAETQVVPILVVVNGAEGAVSAWKLEAEASR